MTARPASSRSREMLHTGMWTLLGMMALGLALVPLLRPSIVLTSLFFGWSNVMVAYMAWRIVQDVRRRAPGPRAPPSCANVVSTPVVQYRVRSDRPAGERPSTVLAPEP